MFIGELIEEGEKRLQICKALKSDPNSKRFMLVKSYGKYCSCACHPDYYIIKDTPLMYRR